MAKFDYPYKKSVNVTAWVLQIIVCLILLGASAWLMSIVNSGDYDSVLGQYDGLFTAAAGLQIALTAVTIVLDIVEMVLIARKALPPAMYLTSACIKTAIWGVIFIINLIGISILSIILTAILLSTSLSQLIYGAKLVHRQRKGTLTGGNYAPAHNPAGHVETAYGGVAPHQQPAYNNSDNSASYYAPQQYHQNTEYKSQSPSPPQYGYAAPAPTHQPQYGYGQQGQNTYELDSRHP